MSWVTFDDAADFSARMRSVGSTALAWVPVAPDLRSRPGDATFHNILPGTAAGPKYAVLLRERVPACGDADAFFAAAEAAARPRPVVAVFVSRDESVVGRCTTVQACGTNSMAVTLVHSHVDVGRVSQLLVESNAVMARHELNAERVRRLSGDPGAIASVLDDLAFVVFVALKRYVDCAGRVLGACGEAPDLVALSADVPGLVTPVLAANGRRYVRAAATFELPGCVVAVVHVDVVGTWWSADDDFVRRLLGVRVVFVVGSGWAGALECDNVSTSPWGVEGTTMLVVNVRDVPVAHVVHVIEPATDAALRCPDALAELKSVLGRACDADTDARIRQRRGERSRARAVRVIARAVDANLDGILKRLWRPDGGLARGLAAKWHD